MESDEPGPRAGIGVGVGFIALGSVIAWNTAGMSVPPTYAKVGPQVFPFATAAVLAVIGAVFIRRGLAERGIERRRADEPTTDWTAVLVIAGALLFQAFFIERLGFIVSSAILFTAVSFAFGSRQVLRDVIIGVIVAVLAWLLFAKILNLRLPAGVLGSMF